MTHPLLGDEANVERGNGSVLWFETDDFDSVMARVASSRATVADGPLDNPLAQHREIWLRDLDGYVVVVASAYGTISREESGSREADSIGKLSGVRYAHAHAHAWADMQRCGKTRSSARLQSYRGVMGMRHPDVPLTDGVIELRRWSFADLGCVEEAGLDPRIPAGTTVPARWSAEAGRDFIERQWSRAEKGEGVSLAIHAYEPNRAVGMVSMMLRPQAGVTGLGYWIVPSARAHGYATRAALLASDWAIGFGGFARIEAWVDPDNIASQLVLATAEFTLEGRLRSFLEVGGERSDALVYSRIQSHSPDAG